MTKAPEKQLNWRDYERNNDDVKKAEVLKIPLHRIFIREGFNPRDINKPETQEKIQRIKEAYKAGEYVKPIEVSLSGDQVEVVDGHCRVTAATLAQQELVAEGVEDAIPFLVCVPFKGNDLERLAHTVHGNEGEKLTPIECAEVVRRLQALGLVRESIATKLRFSIGWVDRLIVAAKLPQQIKNEVQAGKVSLDVAVKLFKENGEEGAVKALAETRSSAEAEGSDKITAKHVKDKAAAKEARDTLKKLEAARMEVSRELAQALPKKLAPARIKDDEVYTLELTGATIKKLREMQAAFASDDYTPSEAPAGGGKWPFNPKGVPVEAAAA